MAYAEKRGKGEYPWRVKFKRPDGTMDQASGFRTKQDALNYGGEQEADARRGRWHDPKRGEVTLDDYFWHKWLPAQRISDKTRANREGEYRTHLAPRWGTSALNDIDPFDVLAFEKQLRERRSKSTTDNVMELLRLMLDDAVFAGMLQYSPVRPKHRRGQRETDTARRGVVTTLEQIQAIRARLVPSDALLVLVIAFTGMRWGEAIGVRRSFLTLDPGSDGSPAGGYYVIDKDVGAVHEDPRTGRRYFGPPKGGKGRTVELPPFLAELLAAWLETFPRERDLLFVNRAGAPHSRTNFNSIWRRACDGWPGCETVQGRAALVEAPPVHAELTVHDLRHTHKTWLAEDGVEPVARDERLGHATPGMDGVYIHATPAMRRKVLTSLELRWSRAAGMDLPSGSQIGVSDQARADFLPAS